MSVMKFDLSMARVRHLYRCNLRNCLKALKAYHVWFNAAPSLFGFVRFSYR